MGLEYDFDISTEIKARDCKKTQGLARRLKALSNSYDGFFQTRNDDDVITLIIDFWGDGSGESIREVIREFSDLVLEAARVLENESDVWYVGTPEQIAEAESVDALDAILEKFGLLNERDLAKLEVHVRAANLKYPYGKEK